MHAGSVDASAKSRAFGYATIQTGYTMMHTHKATLQPDGRLQFADAAVHLDQRPRRVLVTFTDEEPDQKSPATASDWQGFVGALADSPHWTGDPVAIQRSMHDEWG